MPVKVKISYTPDEEAKITRLEALMKSLLPRHKVKKSTGTPPITTCISHLRKAKNTRNRRFSLTYTPIYGIIQS